MNKSLLLAGMVLSILFSCGKPDKEDFDALNARAAKEYLEPLRPGYEEGNSWWNVFAHRFLYAPAFDFKEIEGAKEYRFELKSAENGSEWSFTADAPWNPLSPVWNDVTVGNISQIGRAHV